MEKFALYVQRAREIKKTYDEMGKRRGVSSSTLKGIYQRLKVVNQQMKNWGRPKRDTVIKVIFHYKEKERLVVERGEVNLMVPIGTIKMEIEEFIKWYITSKKLIFVEIIIMEEIALGFQF